MTGEKGFMLRIKQLDGVEWKENLVNFRQETVEKSQGLVEIRRHHVFDTQKDAVDFIKELPGTKVGVTSKKQAEKALKAKMQEAKKKQANTGRRYGVVNGETVEMQTVDQRLMDAMENLGEADGMDIERKMHEDKRRRMIEKNPELYEEMKADIEEIKKVSDLQDRIFYMKGYYQNFKDTERARHELFKEFFWKEYNELIKQEKK